MKLKFVLLAALSVFFSNIAVAEEAHPTEGNAGEMMKAGAPEKKEVKRHSHVQEKMGVAPSPSQPEHPKMDKSEHPNMDRHDHGKDRH